MQLPFAVWLTRALLPLVGVLVALVLLVAASAATVLDTTDPTTRWHLFFAGVNTYLASMIWGTWVNRRPLRHRAAPLDPEETR